MQLSEREWRKTQAAERINAGEWTVGEGARALGLSERQMRRICRRVHADGAEGVIHRNRGKTPKNRISEAMEISIVELARGRYAGSNDTHLAEKPLEVEKIRIGRETLRQLLRRFGLGPTRKRRTKRVYRRRERKAQEGLMLLWDGSQYA